MQSLTLLRNAGFLDETPQKLAQFITKVRGVGLLPALTEPLSVQTTSRLKSL
jgi:hypothetical protein